VALPPTCPCDLGQFDTVISCLTFHEVGDIEDKTVSLRQALAHVRPGGRFAFIDLFGDSKFYHIPPPSRLRSLNQAV
jgi:hypothetical protein